MSVDLRHGRWQDVLAGVTCDMLLADPPFSAKTHAGALGSTNQKRKDKARQRDIDFAPWSHGDVEAFVDAWAPRVRCWIVVMTDDVLVPHFRAEFRNAGLVDFAPLPIVFADGGFRLQGDGPASVSLWLVVGRRRGKLSGGRKIWRSLPGYYLGPTGPDQGGGRGKPAWLLDDLVRDYSDRGHVVVDPMAGYGQALASARNAGRTAIGAEENEPTYHAAVANLTGNRAEFLRRLPQRPVVDDATPSLFASLESPCT